MNEQSSRRQMTKKYGKGNSPVRERAAHGCASGGMVLRVEMREGD